MLKLSLFIPSVVCLLLLLCSSSSANQRGWLAKNIPNPKQHPSACLDLSKSKYAVSAGGEAELEKMWLCDVDRILSPETIDEINMKLTEVSETKRNEECQRGTQVGVVVVEKMASGSSADDAEAFAKAVHNSWGVGDRTCNNGALLFVSISDRKWYISIGSGVKDLLTTRLIDRIGDNMKPIFREGDYDRAVLKGVHEIAHILLVGEFQGGEGLSFDAVLSWIMIIFVALWILYGAISLVVLIGRWLSWYAKNAYRRFHSRRRARKALDELKRRVRAGHNVAITMCPICLESFADTPSPSAPQHGHPSVSGQAVLEGSSSSSATTDQHGEEKSSSNHDDHEDERRLEEDDDETELLFCGHKFHKKCISSWLDRNDSCPICRRRAPRDEVEPDASEHIRVMPADDAFFRFAETRVLHNFAFWNIPTPPVPANSFWAVGSVGGGGSAFGGGISFGGGGGGW